MTNKKFGPPTDYRYLETVAVVMSGDDAYQELWECWGQRFGVPWRHESRGEMLTIATRDNSPIEVDVRWAFIAEKRVAFVYGCSLLVDHRMIEAWTKAAFPRACLRSNAKNFHNIIHGLKELLNVKSLLQRDPIAIDRAIEALPACEDFLKPKGTP